MSKLSKSGRSPKTELGRERIVIEALALIDEKGLSSLSMRTLASRLSVYPSAIYWYVQSRSGLLAAIVEHVLADILPDAEELDWQAWVFTLMQSYRSAVMRHPNIAPLLGADLASNLGVDINVVDKLLRVLSLQSAMQTLWRIRPRGGMPLSIFVNRLSNLNSMLAASTFVPKFPTNSTQVVSIS